jgi:hypothetical protein
VGTAAHAAGDDPERVLTRAGSYRPPMRNARIGAALALALTALTRPAVAQDEYHATGEVRFHGGGIGSGASFSPDRVVGPAVNMTRREDGGWAGDLVGQNLDLRADPGRLSGPNVNLVYAQKGGTITVEGLWFGRRVRFTLDPKKFEGRFGGCSFDMRHAKARGAVYQGDIGCVGRRGFPATAKGGVELLGDAAQANPPLQQLALALVAAMPG